MKIVLVSCHSVAPNPSQIFFIASIYIRLFNLEFLEDAQKKVHPIPNILISLDTSKTQLLFHRIFCNSDFCFCFSTASMSCMSRDIPRCMEAKEKYWGNVQKLEQHLYKLYLPDTFMLVAFIRVIDACHVTHWGQINVKTAVHTTSNTHLVVLFVCFVLF